MCSINWTKSRGHILFYKILSKRSHWAVKDEEPCLFYCKDTPNSLGGMRLLRIFQTTIEKKVSLHCWDGVPTIVPNHKLNGQLHYSIHLILTFSHGE